MNEQTSELKACPFCGSAPRLSGGDCRIYGRNWFSVVCDNCGIWIQDREVWLQDGSGLLDPNYPAMECVARWNTRPAQSPIVQAADEMEVALSRVCGVLRCRYTKLPIQPNDGCHCTFCDEHASAQAALKHYAKAKGQ
jgi:hypothetical protein